MMAEGNETNLTKGCHFITFEADDAPLVVTHFFYICLFAILARISETKRGYLAADALLLTSRSFIRILTKKHQPSQIIVYQFVRTRNLPHPWWRMVYLIAPAIGGIVSSIREVAHACSLDTTTLTIVSRLLDFCLTAFALVVAFKTVLRISSPSLRATSLRKAVRFTSKLIFWFILRTFEGFSLTMPGISLLYLCAWIAYVLGRRSSCTTRTTDSSPSLQ